MQHDPTTNEEFPAETDELAELTAEQETVSEPESIDVEFEAVASDDLHDETRESDSELEASTAEVSEEGEELSAIDAANVEVPLPVESVSADVAENPLLSQLLEAIGELRFRTQTGFERMAAELSKLQTDEEERDEHRLNREALYEKLQDSRPTYQAQMIRPFILRLADLHDLITTFIKCPPSADEKWLQATALFRNHVEETLRTHGAEMICPAVGDLFDSKLHHIIGTQPTVDSDQDTRVAEVSVAGLRLESQTNAGDFRTLIVRQAKIVTWKYDPTLAEAEPSEDVATELAEAEQKPGDDSSPDAPV